MAVKKHETNQSGFTIVELLVVIVVIAILASIITVAYNGITAQSHNASVQNDIRNIAQQARLYHADKGVYPTGNQLAVSTVTVSKGSYLITNNAMLYCAPPDGLSFAIIGKSKSGTTYYASHLTSGVATATFGFPTGMVNDCPNAGSASGGSAWLHTNNGTSLWAGWVNG